MSSIHPSSFILHPCTNVVFAGLGGQGVLKASDILAEVAFQSGQDVKKADVHGMSQRGGSVTSDVRFGPRVLSPMVPSGEADLVVVLAEEEVPNSRALVRPGGVLITPSDIDAAALPHRRSLNVALLGVLSRHLEFSEDAWHAAICRHLKPELHEVNWEAFRIGRSREAVGGNHD
jgi:indolepyruvate ferredoxin oxidoreductase beta subunit